jgi:hypothetical protein
VFTAPRPVAPARWGSRRCRAGEAYESKAAPKNGIASVQKNATSAQVVDLTE